MNGKLISMDAAPYFLMHLLGAHSGSGVMFLVRQGREFGLLPFFPGQGTRRPEEDLHSDVEVVNALLGFVEQEGEIVGRLRVDFDAVRGDAGFWTETIGQLTALNARRRPPPRRPGTTGAERP